MAVCRGGVGHQGSDYQSVDLLWSKPCLKPVLYYVYLWQRDLDVFRRGRLRIWEVDILDI